LESPQEDWNEGWVSGGDDPHNQLQIMLSKESADVITTPKGLGLAVGLGLIAAPFTGGMS